MTINHVNNTEYHIKATSNVQLQYHHGAVVAALQQVILHSEWVSWESVLAGSIVAAGSMLQAIA